MIRCTAFAILAAWSALAESPALEVAAVRWGFDGTVVAERFNLLSVLVENRDHTPFDADVALNEGGMLKHSASYVAHCYLAPGTRRWLQFHPYVATHAESFSLAWRTVNPVELDEAQSAPPASVFLVTQDSLAASTHMPSFPEELFPTSVAGTDGLGLVVLDHAPRWPGPRRAAFADWLHAGGVVHLLRGDDSRFPVFADTLAALNRADQRFTVGAGRVIRHDCNRAEFTPALLEDSAAVAPVLQASEKHAQRGELAPRLFHHLASLVRSDHDWTMIFGLLIGYMALIGPGAWLAGRLRVDYRLVNAGLVAAIVAGTWMLAQIGRRGYGEKTVLHSVAYARSLGGDGWDVSQWGNLFVTASDRYRLSRPGTLSLYACSSASETIDAAVAGDPQGSLETVIPLCSSRSFLHRARCAGPDSAVTVEQWDPTDLTSLILGAESPLLSEGGEGMRAWAMQGLRFVELQRAGGKWGAFGANSFLLEDIDKHFRTLENFGNAYSYLFTGSATDRKAVYAQLGEPMFAYAAGGIGLSPSWIDRRDFRWGALVHLLIYREAPIQFNHDISDTAQVGKVLYDVVLDVAQRPESP